MVEKGAVMELHGRDTETQVFFYEHEFYPLSSFSSFRLWWKWIDFPTLEYAYHWEKFEDPEMKQKILDARSSHDALKIAHENKDKVRENWRRVRVPIMRELMWELVKQHPYVKKKLFETGDREIIEDSWRDDFWGWGPDRNGQNWKGKLWMEIRDEMMCDHGGVEESVEFVENPKRKEKVQKLIDEGYEYYCLKCHGVYKRPRREFYEDGHGGRRIDMCTCGCDLFGRLEDVRCVSIKVKEPEDGTLVFREHHAKYCKCHVGEIWTGDASTECWPNFELVRDDIVEKTFRCSKSGLKIVILKSTKKELEEPDEVGSSFLRIPSARGV